MIHYHSIHDQVESNQDIKRKRIEDRMGNGEIIQKWFKKNSQDNDRTHLLPIG